jgi:hypothetical protein
MNNKDRIIKWIEVLLKESSKFADNKGIELLHQCGGACSEASLLIEGALKIRNEYQPHEDIDKLFKTFKTQYYNTSRLTKKGNRINLVFEECTCPLVKEGVRNSFLCNCTIGYSKKIFETLFGRTVRANLLESILKGDSICKQEIIIENNLIPHQTETK